MARNNFKLIGKIQLGKETEKFKPYKVSKSAKGWIGHRLSFGLKNITGFHNLELFAGYMEDGTSLIYCIQKKENYSDETVKLQIKWEDRNNPEIIEQVSDYNKMSIKINEEEKVYISGYDFLEDVYKLLQDENMKDKTFCITGDVEYQEYEGKVYRKLHPRHIELVSDDTKQTSLLNLELYYTKNAVATELFEDTKKYFVDTYVAQYDSELKEDVYMKEEVVIDVSKAQTPAQEKAFDIIKNRFVVEEEDKVIKLGVKAILVNGREKKQITMDDLTDEERDLIECGLATFEDLAAEYGNQINGDSISEIKVVGFGYGYNKGSQETGISPSRLSKVNDELDDMFDNDMFGDDSLEDDLLPFTN